MSTTTALTLRDLHPRDLAAAHRLSASIPWPHRLEDWRVMLAAGHGLAACGPNGRLLGTTLWWNYGAAATIGMVLVDPAHQGQGIGRRLMVAVLERTGARALMLNATIAGMALYRRLGFHPTGRIAQHQGVLSAFECTNAIEAPDLPSLQALDARAFGAERPGFYANLTDFTAIRLADSPGFALRRRFGRGEVIGPVVAASETDAIALVGASLRPGFQRIDIPADATTLAAWLTAAGLPQVDLATTMIRGEWPKSSNGLYRFALATQAQG